MKPTIPLALALAATGAERQSLEAFIAERFRCAYGAHIRHFCAELLGVRGADGQWQAGAGYTPAGGKPLFLEQYLDAPVELALQRLARRPLARRHIVEVGNLTATAGLCRLMIPALGRHLHEHGFRWVVFTATRSLRNAFQRLGLQPLFLAPALAARLPDAGASWGSYYAHAPSVMGGPIEACLGEARAA